MPATEKPSKWKPEDLGWSLGFQGERLGVGAAAPEGGVKVCDGTSAPAPTPSGLADNPVRLVGQAGRQAGISFHISKGRNLKLRNVKSLNL